MKAHKCSYAVSTFVITILAISPLLSLRLSAQSPTTATVVKTINVDINPFGDTLSPDGKTVWVANSGTVGANSNKLTIIDVPTLTEEPNKITVGQFPEDIAFGRLGVRAFVTNSSSATVSVINVNTRKVEQTVSLAQVPDNFPFGIAVGLGDAQVFVTTQGNYNLLPVLENALSGVSVKTSIPVNGFSGRPALVPPNLFAPLLSGDILVPVSPFPGSPEVDIVNPLNDMVVNTVSISGYQSAFPNAIAVSPDGHYAYVTLTNFSGGPGGLWVIDLTTLATVTVVNTGDPTAYGVQVAPSGKYVLVTNFLKNTVALIDTANNRLVDDVPVGTNPNDIAITLDSKEAFITNQGDTTVSVLAVQVQ